MQLATIDNQLTMSSREVADLVESRHDDVKRSIERLALKEVIQQPPMAEVKNSQGQTVSVYLLNKRDSYVVVAQLSPAFTAKLVDRWQELEAKQAPLLPTTYIQALERLIETEKQKEAALIALDVAIATKAEIGSRREATSMATASVAVRERNKVLEELGRAQSMATIRAVNKATGEHFQFKPLKDYCKAKELDMGYATDPLYGEVRTYPAQAWLEVYGIHLNKLF
jgi:phage regulator Rha-like protein